MDAIKLLTKDHDTVKKLLEERVATTARASKKRTRKLMDKQQLEALGEQLHERKEELLHAIA